MTKGKKIQNKLDKRRSLFDNDPKKISPGGHGMTRPGSQNLRNQ